jgi:hypothetical protein
MNNAVHLAALPEHYCSAAEGINTAVSVATFCYYY